jgi:hypothetical protein
VTDRVRPSELWLGEIEPEAGKRELILDKALPTEAEVLHELETEWHYGAQDLHPTFHCYVERRRCRDCAKLKDGPIVGPIRKAQGSPKTWCDYWACYGASPDGYCNYWSEK